jgi:hypothetical protein
MQFVVIQKVKLFNISCLTSEKSQKQSNQLILITFNQLIQKTKKMGVY